MTDSSTFTNLFNNIPPLKRIIPSLSYTSDTTKVGLEDPENYTLHDYGIESFNDDLRNFSSPTLVNDQQYLSKASLLINEVESTTTILQGTKSLNSLYNYIGEQEDDDDDDELIEMNNHQLRWQNLVVLWRELKDSILKNTTTLHEFFDEFRYMLVTSQLLDETILISNFYNSSNNQIRKQKSKLLITGHMKLHYGELTKLKTLFKFKVNHSCFSYKVVEIIQFVKYIKKSKVLTPIQRKFITVIVLLNLNSLLKFIKVKNILITHILLSQLKKSISIFQQFDVLIMKIFRRFKEFKLYDNQIIMPMNHTSQPHRNIIKLNHSNKLTLETTMYEILNSSLTLMTNSIIKSIKVLLPFSNRYDLENFVDIYNINLVELNYLINENLSNINLVELTQEKIKKLQKLRRFLFTVLLSINLNSNLNNYDFVWGKLLRIFQLDVREDNFFILDQKLQGILSELHELSLINESINITLSNFIATNKQQLYSSSSPPHNTQPSLPSSSTSSSHTTPPPFEKAVRLSSLDIQDKLKELLFNFQTVSNYEELQHIGDSITNLMQTYKKTVQQLKPKVVAAQRKPSIQSLNNNIKQSKRFSLQAHQLRSFTSPLSMEASLPMVPATTTSKRSKRLSTGLPIPLLTVLEASQKAPPLPTSPSYDHGKRLVSYDDNYINNSTLDSYSVDDLTLKISPPPQSSKNNREDVALARISADEKKNLEYIDDLISNDDSVIITNDTGDPGDEEDGLVDGMTSAEFKAKLEMNFAMMTSSIQRGAVEENELIDEKFNSNSILSEHILDDDTVASVNGRVVFHQKTEGIHMNELKFVLNKRSENKTIIGYNEF